MQYSDISLVYIFNYTAHRLFGFLKHWYVDGFLQAVDWTLHVFERMDRSIALRITVKNWLQPLYQDYTIIGYVWGFIFRTARILIGLMVYGAVLAIAAALFLLWISLPILTIYQIFNNL